MVGRHGPHSASQAWSLGSCSCPLLPWPGPAGVLPACTWHRGWALGPFWRAEGAPGSGKKWSLQALFRHLRHDASHLRTAMIVMSIRLEERRKAGGELGGAGTGNKTGGFLEKPDGDNGVWSETEVPWAASEPLSQSPPSNALMRQSQRKDSRAFFSFPMTDGIAPGSSMTIIHPADFSTMKD